MTIRVIVADDHQIMRQGLRALFFAEPGMELVAEAENGRQAIDMARQHMPDVVIMDIGMPDINGIDATRAIIKENPAIKVIALSMHSDRKYILEMFRAGAKGFLRKDCAFFELAEAIMLIQAGQSYLDKTMAGIFVDGIMCAENVPPEIGLSALTEREIEVLRLMTQEVCTKDIASALKLGEKTIGTYQYRMKNKLNIFNMVGLTKFAIRHGLACVGEKPPLA
jgi:DNA-binding NarL/FixJ family response regulator